MSTTWVPMTRFEPRSWLLANGEVVEEPPLEQTSTGRKVRVAGTSDSFYSKDLDDLLAVAAKNIAATKGTSVFLPLHGQADSERHALPAPMPAKLHLTDASGTTTVWWKFRHASMPYSVTVIATLTQDRWNKQALKVHAVQPQAFGHYGNTTEGRYNGVDNSVASLYGLPGQYLDKWTEFLRDNPLTWTKDTLDTPDRQIPTSRMAAEALLKIVREMEDHEEILWPDFRDVSEPGYMDLELYDSNVNSQFVADLTDYLDGSPTVDKAEKLYGELIETLKACGLVIERDDDKNDFMRALNNGTIRVTVNRLAEEKEEIDHSHAVVINLATGTMLVECSVRGVNNNTIAEQWEEAKTVAALTGEEDELLAYARAYREQSEKKRTERILKERGA